MFFKDGDHLAEFLIYHKYVYCIAKVSRLNICNINLPMLLFVCEHSLNFVDDFIVHSSHR